MGNELQLSFILPTPLPATLLLILPLELFPCDDENAFD